MGWTAVTFYTEGTGYQAEAEKLIASAAAFRIPITTYAAKNLGNWRQNLNHKSATILRAMADHPGQDIVFLDADAIVRAYPEKFDELSVGREWDIAACFFRRSRLENDELLSGTLWIANTDKGHEIVERWNEYGRRHPETRHQKCLHLVLLAMAEVQAYRLDDAYTRIFDHPGMKGVTPIIEHFQASRRLRHRLGTVRPGEGSPFPSRAFRGR